MTYGDDRTAGAMGDDERRDYVRQDGAAMAASPDGPSRDLRERCAHAYYRLRWARDDWQHMAPVHREAYYEVADAILAEIAAAGMVIVDAGRFERVRATARGAERFRSLESNEERVAGLLQLDMALRKLQPGDLDPTEPVEGQR